LEKDIEFPKTIPLEDVELVAREWRLVSVYNVELLRYGEPSKFCWFGEGEFGDADEEFVVCSCGDLVRAVYKKTDEEWVLEAQDDSLYPYSRRRRGGS
jgi:hypothetical protein